MRLIPVGSWLTEITWIPVVHAILFPNKFKWYRYIEIDIHIDSFYLKKKGLSTNTYKFKHGKDTSYIYVFFLNNFSFIYYF